MKQFTPALCHLSDLRDGEACGFDPFKKGRDSVFVVRRGERIHAFLDICPHYGQTPLPWKKNAYLTKDGSRILCSAHGATFDIPTGLCVLGPCLGQSLTSVEVSISEGGEIRLLLDPGGGAGGERLASD
ncbi:Rieske (2Fe-2S) protein [Bradyrhizobium sp. STM 3561]|uniref:Rieske (2Fe-2S) protein n=1 Tax=unclassified Bradyrhizobium TaxID=2631580 RepID=UPI00388F69A0